MKTRVQEEQTGGRYDFKAEHLQRHLYRKKTLTAVDDVSFELKQGECLGIVGESGSVKARLQRCLHIWKVLQMEK